MSDGSTPTITVVVAAYQAEEWLTECLDSILGQTRAPDQVVVVDDGSTDGTAAILQTYADRITVVRRENGGCPAAFNTAFSHATGDFVALCGSDDIWEPYKLERQQAAMVEHPDADILFGHAVLFGRIELDHGRPTGRGMLDPAQLREDLFVENIICAPTVVIRRALFERLGPFVEKFGADDYEYWFRALRAGARFYYDDQPLMRWRQHGANLSWKSLWMDECTSAVRLQYEADVPNRAVIDRVLARQLFRLGRALVDDGRPAEARVAFRRSLRYRRGASAAATSRSLVWTIVLTLPPRARDRLSPSVVGLSRLIDGMSGGRDPVLP